MERMLAAAKTLGAAMVCLGAAAACTALAVRQNGRNPAPSARLGIGASLGGRRVFPADYAWNTDITRVPVDPNSDLLIASIGLNKPLHPDFGTVYGGHHPNGIPYVVISGEQARKTAPVEFEYKEEIDPGAYAIPADAPIEGGPDADGDRHVLDIDRHNWTLYELFSAHPEGRGSERRWKAGSGAIFDLSSSHERPAGWTSADAAGLPVFPGLVRYDETMEAGEITHALRFTVRHSRRGYVAPARHFASRSNDESLPPMGMRVRLKAAYDISGFPRSARTILRALKKYGMILADNGGDWFVSGSPDPRWNDDEIGALKRIKGSDLEVVKMGPMVTR